MPGAGALGMVIFLASLAVLFLAAIAGYLVVRLRATAWPPPGMPRLPSGLWIATLVLLACSATVHRAHRSIRLGETTATTRWLGATLGFGLLFLVVQVANWWRLISLDMGIHARNLYAFTFYMLTGLHAAHVVGGLVLLGVVSWRASRGRYGSGHHPGVTYAEMYWHFLDAVWIVVFAVLLVFG